MNRYMRSGRRYMVLDCEVSMIPGTVWKIFKTKSDNQCRGDRRRKIVGAILCGHDGRRGCLYHVCVDEAYRRRGIGKAMVVQSMEALKEEGISNVSLIAFTQNDIGNAFWNTIGWNERQDLNYYDFVLNTENITAFNAQ